MLNGSIDGLPGLYGATAAADGKFSINRNCTPAHIRFWHNGSASSTMLGYSDTTRLTLKAGDHKTDVNLRLTPTGAITGRITNANGEAVEGASVELRGAHGGESCFTDETGRFRIGGLAPGQYRIKASVTDLFGGSPGISDGRNG